MTVTSHQTEVTADNLGMLRAFMNMQFSRAAWQDTRAAMEQVNNTRYLSETVRNARIRHSQLDGEDRGMLMAMAMAMTRRSDWVSGTDFRNVNHWSAAQKLGVFGSGGALEDPLHRLADRVALASGALFVAGAAPLLGAAAAELGGFGLAVTDGIGAAVNGVARASWGIVSDAASVGFGHALRNNALSIMAATEFGADLVGAGALGAGSFAAGGALSSCRRRPWSW